MNNSSLKENDGLGKVYIVLSLYCDERKRSYRYNTLLGKRICGVAVSLESAERLLLDYRRNYECAIAVGYRIEERNIGESYDHTERCFEYDANGERLSESDFRKGDPVDVLCGHKVILGVISDIEDDDSEKTYCVVSHHTDPTSFYCKIGNLRKPDFLITEDDVKEILKTGMRGISWQKCQEANVSKAKEILTSFAAKLGSGITVTDRQLCSPETTFTFRVPGFPKTGWTVLINITADKVLRDRRKTFVTIRTILRLPTNGERYSYRKAVLPYKSEIQYDI